jgi:hypothetical protein
MVPAFSASVSGLQHRLKRPLLMLSTVVGTGREKKKFLCPTMEVFLRTGHKEVGISSMFS